MRAGWAWHCRCVLVDKVDVVEGGIQPRDGCVMSCHVMCVSRCHLPPVSQSVLPVGGSDPTMVCCRIEAVLNFLNLSLLRLLLLSLLWLCLQVSVWLPGLIMLIFTVLNIALKHTGSLGAVPAGIYFSIVAIWFLVSVPLTFVGGFMATRLPIMVRHQGLGCLCFGVFRIAVKSCDCFSVE